MNFLQEGPPDTTLYMLLGYGVIFAVILVYVISLMVRARNVDRDMALLEDMEEEEHSN